MSKRPSRKFDAWWQQLQAKQNPKRLKRPTKQPKAAKQRKTPKITPVSPRSPFNIKQLGVLSNFQVHSTSNIIFNQLGTIFNQLGTLMAQRKFDDGDTVIVIDANNIHTGKSGSVISYDSWAGSYHVKLEDGKQRVFKPSQLRKTGSASNPNRPARPARVYPGDLVQYESLNGNAAWDGCILEVTEASDFSVSDGTLDLILRQPNYNGSFPLGFYKDQPNIRLLIGECHFYVEDNAKKKVDFDSVVIADEKRQQILEALEQVNQQVLIFEKWGFNKTIEKGKGVSMLFYGPPGTGKTLMAQAIADKLECELKIVAVADLESSEPGQAERNIRDTFKYAKDKKVVLLFDECDSLIFDRTAVGAILSAQVNELLSSLEKFDGITIFTTNRIETLDEAVDRRLALKLEFSMPDQEQRAEIWQRMFPEEAPLSKEVDWMRLASVELAGGHIKNAVLRAARIAATQKLPDTDKKIEMEHLVRALKQEGTAMLAFKKAKEKFFVPTPGHVRMGTGSDKHRVVDKVADVMANMEDS